MKDLLVELSQTTINRSIASPSTYAAEFARMIKLELAAAKKVTKYAVPKYTDLLAMVKNEITDIDKILSAYNADKVKPTKELLTLVAALQIVDRVSDPAKVKPMNVALRSVINQANFIKLVCLACYKIDFEKIENVAYPTLVA